jgi:hypothetical protein
MSVMKKVYSHLPERQRHNEHYRLNPMEDHGTHF